MAIAMASSVLLLLQDGREAASQCKLVERNATETGLRSKKQKGNPAGIIKRVDKTTIKFVQFLYERHKALKDLRYAIIEKEGSLDSFSKGYEVLGLKRVSSHLLEYLEWAPGATSCSLAGDFNNWDPGINRALDGRHGRDDYGFWRILVDYEPHERGEDMQQFVNEARDTKRTQIVGKSEARMKKKTPVLRHGSRYRVHFRTREGPLQRVPAWASYVLSDESNSASAVFWDPPEPYCWKHERPKVKTLRIYECHIGISGEEPRVFTFAEFTAQILPYVKQAGYNAVQLFGIQEHSDYSSVGYKVTNIFAISSRFGTPDDFKRLVDTAHGLGLLVFLDIVHSHFARDESNGLARFDGSADCYFYSGKKRGYHKRWKTRMIRYEAYEVKRFLLSNLRWWVEEYRIDGFYFHSVGSMLYTHNGFARFTGDIVEYCSNVDVNAQMYLILANELLHSLDPYIITIAEDITLYPGLAAPSSQGGLGFDYYVNTAPSDMWLYLIGHVPFEHWSIKQIAETLVATSKADGKVLVYAENHSFAISYGKSLFQALLDRNSMELSTSVFKMIKLLTLCLGGSAYLNFIGSEFGHPDHIDFPKEENGYSYQRARRQWRLLQDKIHSQLAAFDRALMELEEKRCLMAGCGPAEMLKIDDLSKVLYFARGIYMFTFNFHSTKSYQSYHVPVEEPGIYELLMDTDQLNFGGSGRLRTRQSFPFLRVHTRTTKLSLELPSLSAQVYKLVAVCEEQRC